MVQLQSIPPAVALMAWAVTLFALWLAFRDERHESRTQQWLVLFSVGLVVGGVHLAADVPYVDQCSETFLRQICGSWWYECGLLAGCYLPWP